MNKNNNNAEVIEATILHDKATKNLDNQEVFSEVKEQWAGQSKILTKLRSSKIVQRLLKAFQSDSTKAMQEAYKRFAYLMGGFDFRDRVPSRELEVSPAEEADVARLGATKGKDGVWRVGKNVDVNLFKRWWPRIPEDVIPNDADMLKTTADGRAVNQFILIDKETNKGDDSTATSFILAAFPFLSLLTWIGLQTPLIGGLIVLGAVALLIPYTISLFISEGIKRTLIALLTYFLPLIGMYSLMDYVAALDEVGTAIGGGFGSSLYLLLPASLGLLALIYSFIRASLVIEGLIGQYRDRLAFMVKRWVGIAILLGLSLAFALHVGEILGTFMLVGMTMYMWAFTHPMFYTDFNFRVKNTQLAIQGQFYQLGSRLGQGVSHEKALQGQARDAIRDKSPLIYIGRATGVLTNQGYKMGYTKGTDIALSLLDLTMHLLIYGETGSGKTSSLLRPVAMQLALLDEPVGILVTCGKGALANDLRDMLDVVIEPGVRFAPYEGMSPMDIRNVIASLSDSDGNKKGADSLWTKGAGLFIMHIHTILDALVKHEKARIAYCKANLEVAKLEYEAVIQQLNLAKHNKDDAKVRLFMTQSESLWAKLEVLDEIARTPRKWKWTPNSAITLKNYFTTVEENKETSRYGKDAQDVLQFLGYGASEARRKHMPWTVYQGVETVGTELQVAIDYFVKEFLTYDPAQKTSFTMNVNTDLSLFTESGSLLCDKETGEPWSVIEEGVKIEDILTGSKMGVYLPDSKFGKVGTMYQRMIKRRLHTQIFARGEHGDNWREKLPDHCQVFDITDECQVVVTDLEKNAASQTRSLGLSYVFATQTRSGLVNAFGDENAYQHFFEAFLNTVAFSVGEGTREDLARRVGESLMFKLSRSDDNLFDYKQAMGQYKDSVYGTPNHPGRSLFRVMEKAGNAHIIGATELQVGQEERKMGAQRKRLAFDTEKIQKRGMKIVVPDAPRSESQMVLQPSVMNAQLMSRGTAIAILKRAGVQRAEFISTAPVDGKMVAKAIKVKKETGQKMDIRHYWNTWFRRDV